MHVIQTPMDDGLLLKVALPVLRFPGPHQLTSADLSPPTSRRGDRDESQGALATLA